jgi:hypothetical protein
VFWQCSRRKLRLIAARGTASPVLGHIRAASSTPPARDVAASVLLDEGIGHEEVRVADQAEHNLDLVVGQCGRDCLVNEIQLLTVPLEFDRACRRRVNGATGRSLTKAATSTGTRLPPDPKASTVMLK